MTVQIALCLLAASIPLTALVLQVVAKVTPVQFVRLETQFIAFRDEVRKDFIEIKEQLTRTKP